MNLNAPDSRLLDILRSGNWSKRLCLYINGVRIGVRQHTSSKFADELQVRLDVSVPF